MKLTNLARTKKERQESYKPKLADAPHYSYGTCIRLEHEDLKKLGIDITKVHAGDQFRVEAACEVKSVSQNDTAEHKSACLELQIEKIGLERTESSMKEAVDNGIKNAKAY